MVLLTGTELAEAIKKTVTATIVAEKLKLSLAVILIGHEPASEKYVSIKEKACQKAGIGFSLYRFTPEESQTKVISLIRRLNKDNKTTGIIVQLPLPDGFVPNELLEAIDPGKDVDGLNSVNLGRLIKGIEGIFPATPEGTINLLRYYQIPLSGKKVAVIGQSNLVGKPLAQMLLNEEATVMIANDKTKKLRELTLGSDIIISAAGSPGLIKASMVPEGAVVIDIGTTLVGSKIVGDVDFDRVSKKAGFLTPSPGGIGPMTVAMLLSNLLKASKL